MPAFDLDAVKANLTSALNSAVELRIVTYVGTVGLTTTDDKGKLKTHLKIDAPDSANAIVTAIDMVQGDVTNFVPAKFWTPEQAAVLEFHQEQVNFGKDVVNHNLRLASEVMEKLLGLLNK